MTEKNDDYKTRKASLVAEVARDTERFKRDAERHGRQRESEVALRLPLAMLLAERGIIPAEHVSDFCRGAFETRRLHAIISFLLTGYELVESVE